MPASCPAERKGDNKTQREAAQRLEDIPVAEPFAIVATMACLGEGFDEPRLDTLLLATPVSWEGSLTQFVGRIERHQEGKSRVRVVDYADVHVPMLDRMYRKRLRAYRKMGYVPVAPDSEADGARILSAEEALTQMCRDIAQARRTITIRTSALSLKQVQTLIEPVADAAANGAQIHVMVRFTESSQRGPLFERATQALRLAGCRVEQTREPVGGLVIVDDRLVWFGDAPLGRSTEDSTFLRFESAAVAGELLGVR